MKAVSKSSSVRLPTATSSCWNDEQLEFEKFLRKQKLRRVRTVMFWMQASLAVPAFFESSLSSLWLVFFGLWLMFELLLYVMS